MASLLEKEKNFFVQILFLQEMNKFLYHGDSALVTSKTSREVSQDIIVNPQQNDRQGQQGFWPYPP